ncbi:AAA family ATPase [Streptomyces rishiriensis]|uniref:DNA-binding CsgD family transcriptional regulator n=1 Tax=Streptomyces rishiriensis TaxID=68264 RepID=A0ABU0P1S0_STRRH|nr:LuxR family transcriptional regulator [Streptomyces rishiriensis]MDQ0585337.1 DNA-binding CsgD family transcriptional regulator [Streptomyces rishiriensis]
MEKLAERDEEEKTLAQVYGECSLGGRRIVAIEGALASGKTALLASFARDAADAGATVLEASASSFERYQPLGIIDQLLRGCRLFSPGADLEVRALWESAGGEGAHSEISPSILGVLQGAFQYLTDSPQLVMCIDDAHFMDVESLQYLLALMRRMGTAPISIVFTYCPDMGRDSVQRLLQAEILRMPNCTQLDLEPLSETGVATVLEDYFPLETAGRIAADCRLLSGGRPLLVHALAEDYTGRLAESAAQRPVAGPAFGRAVLSCLYRADPVVLQIARAMATLGELRSAAVVARLCGMDPESVARIAASPGVGGLLEHDLLGQPSVREAVLGSMPQNERQDMRSQAARLLHHKGAPALVTAEHLMRIGEPVSWARQVLCEAADQALAGGDPEAAVGYLERAHRECAEGRERIDIAARLTEVMWRYDPAAVKSHLPELVAAAEQGGLSVRQSLHLVRCLLWNGQVEQATRVVTRLGDDPHVPDGEEAVPYAGQLRLWLPLTYPGLVSAPATEDVAAQDADPSASGHRAAAALGAVLRGADGTEAVPAAELVLREALAGAASPASSLASLMVLIYSDHLDKASVWCDALLASMGETYGLVWNAMFTAARAEIHYRLGDLANAKRQAQAALALMPHESWGTAVVVPLSILVLTATAMGDPGEAETYLDIPVPRAAFGTLGGVVYLDARGRLHLARGRHDAALQDFLAAGHLMKIWEMDCPSAVSWRAHAARAYFHKGLSAPAGELLTEQMSLLPAGHLRTRGLTYRALAATLRPDERPPVLLKAANLLDRCGDSLNLAYTLADLGHAYELLGDSVQARRHAHQARTLAGRCAAALPPQPSSAAANEGAGPEPLGESGQPAGRLSSAEWRVAELAARGSTNEQIARKLFITVSTVEQHLTRAYRKLGIRRRTQLPSAYPNSSHDHRRPRAAR